MPTGGLILGVGDFGVAELVTQAESYAEDAAQSALDAVINDKPFVKASQVVLKGQAVYVSNANGTNKIVSLASNDTEVKSSNVYGIAMQNFAINDTLQVVRRGVCSNLNTSSATIGDSVWLGVNGNLLYGIANKPYGTHLVYLGIVTRVHAIQGEIDVDIKNGFEVNELHDVLFDGELQDLDVFGYVAGKWRNVSRYMKIEKYTAENQLPTTGSFSSVYFLNVAGSKYLKYWTGSSYVNASTKADLPKCVSSIQRDYYATFADISTANYAGRNTDVCVIEDETKNNSIQIYFYNGFELVSLTGVQKPTPVIVLNSIANKFVGNPTFELNATSENTETEITYSSSNSDVISVAGNTGTVVGPGSCTITASQASNLEFNSTSDSQTVIVNEPVISAITTDTGTTPTSTLLTVPVGTNSVVLYTTHQSGNLRGWKDVQYDIYVQINSHTVQKIRTYWMNKLVLQVNAGDTIKISSDVARTFRYNFSYHPKSLIPATGTLQTIYTDKTASNLFNPSTGHVLLNNYAKCIKISANGNRTPIYIKERDSAGNWSGTYTYILEPTRDLTIWFSNKYIALGTSNGISLSCTFDGSIVGGSKDERIIIPTITGTSRVVTANDEADFRLKLAQAVAGDEVVIPDGTYTLTVAVNNNTFTANIATGKKGSEGIVIRSQSGNRDNCIIKGFRTVNSGVEQGWFIDNSTANLPAYYKGITFDTSVGVDYEFLSGKHRVINCKFAGVYTADISTGNANSLSFLLNNAGNLLDFIAIDCLIQDGSGDLLNGSGVDIAVSNSINSNVHLINCTAQRAGGLQNSQCLTTHFKLPVHAEGCTFADALYDVVANEVGSSSYTWLTFCTTRKGTRNAGISQSSMYGCDLEITHQIGSGEILDVDTSQIVACFNHFKHYNSTNYNTLFRSYNVRNEHNIIESMDTTTGRRAFLYTLDVSKATSIGNVIKGFADAISHNSFPTSPASTATQRIYNNTIVGNTNGIAGGEINATLRLANNAFASNSNGISNVPTAVANKYISEGYNVIDPVVDADYILGTGDSKTVDASLDSNYIPTSAGNCDVVANNSVLGFVGDRDIYGLLFIAKNVPIGARSIQRYFMDSILIPEAY